MKILSTCVITAIACWAITPAANADLLHRYSFDSNVNDSVGVANGSLFGTASVLGGQLELPGGGGVRTNYASIPISGTIAGNASLSVESWFTLDALANWSKVWMFGTAGGQPAPLSYINFTPRIGINANQPKIDFDTTLAGEFNTVGGNPDPAALTTGLEYYVAVIYDSSIDTMSYYINGTLADSALMGGGNVSQLGLTAQNFIGAAVNFGDPDLDGRVNELRIWNNALPAAQIASQAIAGPNTVVPEPGSAALLGTAFAVFGLCRRRKS